METWGMLRFGVERWRRRKSRTARIMEDGPLVRQPQMESTSLRSKTLTLGDDEITSSQRNETQRNRDRRWPLRLSCPFKKETSGLPIVVPSGEFAPALGIELAQCY